MQDSIVASVFLTLRDCFIPKTLYTELLYLAVANIFDNEKNL